MVRLLNPEKITDNNKDTSLLGYGIYYKCKMLNDTGPRSQSCADFWSKFTHSFFKLDHFII